MSGQGGLVTQVGGGYTGGSAGVVQAGGSTGVYSPAGCAKGSTGRHLEYAEMSVGPDPSPVVESYTCLCQ